MIDPMPVAWRVIVPNVKPALFDDYGRALAYAAQHHGTIEALALMGTVGQFAPSPAHGGA